MSLLLLDIGNTRVKWQWQSLDEGLLICAGQSLSGEPVNMLIKQLCSKNIKPKHVAVSSVKNNDYLNRLVSEITLVFGLVPFVASVERQFFGLSCGYEDHKQFGVDRWLSLLGAKALTDKAFCVVDCGSAMTFDWVSREGAHKGGFIVAGLKLSVAALLSGTDEIKADFAAFEAASMAFGINTSQAVFNGVLYAAVCQIDSVVRQAEGSTMSSLDVFITGGDAGLIAPHLSIEHQVVDSLVFDGLKVAAGWVQLDEL